MGTFSPKCPPPPPRFPVRESPESAGLRYLADLYAGGWINVGELEERVASVLDGGYAAQGLDDEGLIPIETERA